MRILLFLCSFFAQDRSPVPDVAAQKEAEKVIRDIFKEDYAKKTPSDRQALAGKLRSQAKDTKDNPASQYVLLREAQELFAQTIDLDSCFGTIDEMGRSFAVEPATLKSAALATATKAAKTPEDLTRLANANLKLAGEAALADQYEQAEKAAASAASTGKKIANLALVNRATARQKEIAEAKSKFEKLKKSRETLAGNPEDPAANLAVGQFQCLVKGNWEQGLPLLAKGSDEVLKAAAEKDLAQPKEAADQAGVGDAWWDIGEKQQAANAKENCRGRALFWYDQGQAKLTGLAKTKVDKRLLEGRMDLVHQGSWVDVSDPKLWGRPPGPLEFVSNGGKNTIDKLPAGTFDGVSVRVRIKTDAVFNVQYEPDARAMELQSSIGLISGCRLEATKWIRDAEKYFPKKDECYLTMLNVDGEYRIYVDGKEMCRTKSLNDKVLGIKVSVFSGQVTLDQFKLRKKD